MEPNTKKKALGKALDIAGRAISPKYKADKEAEEKAKNDLETGTKNVMANAKKGSRRSATEAYAQWQSGRDTEAENQQLRSFRMNDVPNRVKKATSKVDNIPKW